MSSVTLCSCCTPCVGVLTVLFAVASVCFCAEKCVVYCALVFLFVLVVHLMLVCWVGWGVVLLWSVVICKYVKNLVGGQGLGVIEMVVSNRFLVYVKSFHCVFVNSFPLKL
jgi:hypothetical protein